MTDWLITVWPPATDSTGIAESPRRLHVQYGSDAKNDFPDGINVTPMGYSAVWDLRRADADALIAWLRLHAGQVFLWTLPRETAGRYWLAGRWTRTIMDDYDHHRINITLQEQFRP